MTERAAPSSVLPSLFLAGTGNEFSNTNAQLPWPITQSSLCHIEAVLDSDHYQESSYWLAVNIHQMFQTQDNQQFFYGLVITKAEVMVFMIDHSVAVASQLCNYCQEPEKIWAIISGLASYKTECTGFDSTI